MIEGRDFARHQGRRDKAGTMRDQITEPLGARRGMQRHQKTFCGRRRIADQHQVEAGSFVGTRGLGDIVWRQSTLDDMQSRRTGRWRHSESCRSRAWALPPPYAALGFFGALKRSVAATSIAPFASIATA